MGRNGSYNQIHHHRNLSTSFTTNSTPTATTTTFLPLLCRISMKDVAETSSCHRKMSHLHQKVSCMGQIKRHNTNNKINPTTTHTTGKIRYTQLKKYSPAETYSLQQIQTLVHVLEVVIVKAAEGANPKSHVEEIKKNYFTRPEIEGGDHRRTKSDNCGVVVPLNLAELDPPLPVVKTPCRRRGEEEGGSLWKRRGGVRPLGGLQIQQIQLPNHNGCLLITPPSAS